MCGRYSVAVTSEELEQVFEAPVVGEVKLPRWNVAPTQDAPVVVVGRQGRGILSLRWGLVPRWAKDPAVGSRQINARAETVATRPAFRDALARHRCLVPADGFYEWAERPGVGRVPFWIHHRRGGLLALAGLRESWRPSPDAEALRTFTILTTEPNRVVAPLHDRMPVVLPPTAWEAWLDPETAVADALALLAPAAEQLLEARAVSTRVNRVDTSRISS